MECIVDGRIKMNPHDDIVTLFQMSYGSMGIQLKTVRLVIVLINIIFFFIGSALVSHGVEILITRRFEYLTEFLSNIGSTLSNKGNLRLISDEILYLILIIPGSILLSLAFFGCSGAITQIRCLVCSYFWLLSTVLFAQTIIIVCLISFRSEIIEELISKSQLFIRDEYRGSLEENPQSTSILLDWMMYHFKCCGIQSKYDFNLTFKWNRTNPWWNHSKLNEYQYLKYPLTCCPMNDTNPIMLNRILSCAIDGNDIYEISCYERLIDVFYSIQNILMIIIVFILLIEMFGLIFALFTLNRKPGLSNTMERSPASYSRIINSNVYL